MNKRTRILFFVFLSLLVVALIMLFWPRKVAGPDLRVAGWGPAQKIEKPEEDGPIDQIEIEMDGKKLALSRGEKGRWLMSDPQGARADRYKVRQILEMFREDLTSVVSSRVRDADIATFGLDPSNRILVRLLKSGVETFALEIGAVKKPEQGYGDGDTFVRLPQADRVYRILSKDLRRPFGDGLKGLRERKLFDFEASDISAVTIINPKAAEERDRTIELASDEKPASEEGKKPDRNWRFVRPEGLAIGDVKSYLNTISGLYASEYVEELPSGIEFSDAYTLILSLADGRKVQIAVSEPGEDGAFVKVDGMAGFAKVSKYSGEQLRKKANDLRDKSIFGVRREDVVAVDITDGARRIAFERGPGGVWKAIKPEGLPLGTSQVDMLLGDIETLKADTILSGTQTPSETGLNAPSVVVRIKTRDGGQRTLEVGKEKEKGTYYARVSGRPEVITIAQWMLSRVRKGPSDLRNKKVFDFSADAIEVIELVHKDETVTLVRTGADAFSATTPKEVENLKKEAVTSLVSTLAGLQAKDFVDKKAGAVGLATDQELKVTVKLKDGSRHILRVSSEKKDSDPYALAPTEKDFGDQVFTLNQYQVRNFQKRLDELM